jgi:hypothetical protein
MLIEDLSWMRLLRNNFPAAVFLLSKHDKQAS